MRVESDTDAAVAGDEPVLLARDPDQGPAVAPMEFQCTFSPPPAEPASADARIGCDGAIAYCSVTSAGEVLPCKPDHCG